MFLSSIVNSVNNVPVWSYTLGRTPLGQVSQQSGNGINSTQSETESFGYDGHGRITLDSDHYQTSSSSVYNSGNVYTWDLANNLQGGSTGWTHNTSNQVTSAPPVSGAPSLSGATGTVGYDANGNVAAINGGTLSWDCWGHLSASSAGSASYTYDARVRRVSKTVAGVTTYFLYGGSALIAELDRGGNITRSYNWGPLGLISDTSSGISRFYLYDGVGNTRMLLNATGLVIADCAYTGWGSVYSASSLPTPFGWKGQWGAYRDAETNLIQMGARYYSPALGRFISRDPSGFGSGPNLYGFCAGDPINFFDPTGCGQELEDGPVWGTVRSAAGAVDWLNQPVQFFRPPMLPAINPFRTLISAHDSFRDWGEAEGNTKSSPEKLMTIRAGAVIHFGLAAFEFGSYGMMATGGISGMMRPGCFVAGTPVQTVAKGADGKYHTLVKPIEKMRKGDLVFARDPKTGKTQVRRVLRTTIRQVDLVLTVALADAKTHKIVERITASREHPFYVSGKGFVPAGGLAVGNAIVTRAGPPLVVQSIKWNRRAEGYTVYNFVVEDDHSYFVGTHNGGAWVHNPVGDPCFGDPAKLADHFTRHGADFGAADESAYERQAAEFLTGPRDPSTVVKVRPNGDTVLLNQATDEFGVLSATNKIRTYYKPDPTIHGYPTNLDYFNAQ